MTGFLNQKHVDRLLQLVSESEKALADMRVILGNVKASTTPSTTEIDIPVDGWTSYKTKKPADPDEEGWRFSSTRSGEVYAEVTDLVAAIKRDGKVLTEGFFYTMSKDGKFLQRRLKKK